MYLPNPSRPDCATAWLAAARNVFNQPGHEAFNVLVDVEAPVICNGSSRQIIENVDRFLRSRAGGKPLMTVANTIFPQAIYDKHGAQGMYQIFHETLLPKIRKSCNWTGYYFERMTKFDCRDGRLINPVQDVIDRIRDPKVKALNKFEIAIFDPERDLSKSPYGGQCLSHLSFKIAKAEGKLILTAFYRNHYYVEKLLGNLIGLSQLLNFVARESGIEPGSLTILSSHASTINQCGGATVGELRTLIERCETVAYEIVA